jgi:hypothetical protein
MGCSGYFNADTMKCVNCVEGYGPDVDNNCMLGLPNPVATEEEENGFVLRQKKPEMFAKSIREYEKSSILVSVIHPTFASILFPI